MKWLIRLLLLFVVIVAVIYGVGWLLPVEHLASRTAALNASQQQVYDTIADVANYSQWWSEIERVEMLPSADGRVHACTSSPPRITFFRSPSLARAWVIT